MSLLNLSGTNVRVRREKRLDAPSESSHIAIAIKRARDNVGDTEIATKAPRILRGASGPL